MPKYFGIQKYLVFFKASKNNGPSDESFSTIAYAFSEEEAIQQVKDAAALSNMVYTDHPELVIQFKTKGRVPNKLEENLLNSMEVVKERDE